MKLTSTIALVSGGASGLGQAVVRRLVGHGARVVIADLNKDAATTLASSLGPTATAVVADCTSEEQVSEALDVAEKTFGSSVTAAISTAGTLYAAKAVSRKGVPHPLQPFEHVLRVNVLGSFNVARLAAQRMAASEPDVDSGERGVIVQTASIAAFDGQVRNNGFKLVICGLPPALLNLHICSAPNRLASVHTPHQRVQSSA